jgi:hypothetical protein
MSGLIVPESCKPGFVQGRRLLPCGDLMSFIGQLVFVRHPSPALTIPREASSGYIGIFQGFGPDPAYPKRAAHVFLLGGHAPAGFSIIDVKTLEESDPWCWAAGFPERAVSLLEG